MSGAPHDAGQTSAWLASSSKGGLRRLQDAIEEAKICILETPLCAFFSFTQETRPLSPFGGAYTLSTAAPQWCAFGQ